MRKPIPDVIYDYYDFLLDKKRLILHGPPDIDPPPKKSEFNLDDPMERRLYVTKKDRHDNLTAQAKQEQALQILKYVIDVLIDKTPEEALMQFEVPGEAEKYKETWKLDTVIEYVHFPPGIKKNNYKYLFSLIFPKQIKYDEEEQTLGIYRKLLSGEIPRFPRNFFQRNADEKLIQMLHEYIHTHMRVTSIDKLYEKFRDPVAGNKILKDARLFSAYKSKSSSPLEYLHMMLIWYREDMPVLFNVYSFLASYEMAGREERRLKRSIRRSKFQEG